MATTREVRFTETTYGYEINPANATSTGSGEAWVGGSLTLSNTNPNSQTLTYSYIEPGSSSDPSVNGSSSSDGYLLYPHSTGISADRCTVKWHPSLNRSFSVSSGGLGVIFYTTGTRTEYSESGGTLDPYVGGPQTVTTTSYTSASNTVDVGHGAVTKSGSDAMAEDLEIGASVNNFTLGSNKITGAQTSTLQVDTSNDNSNGLHSITIAAATNPMSGTLYRFWEGADIIMNASDSAHTIPAFSSAFTFSAIASALVRHGELEVNSAFTITEDTENFKIAPATEMGMVSSIAVTPSFIIDITKELSSTTEVQSTTYNFVIMDPLTVSSAFTFAVTPVLKVGPAVVNLASAATTSYDSNMIYDVLGDYTWNQFSNNPFIITGYVKGGYTNDAEYEWDDLTTDSWNNWTYGTWLGDEGQWDQWPDNTWERAFKFTSNFTQADTIPLLAHGGASAISSAFTITENAALAKASSASLSSAFTFSGTAQGLIDVTQDLSSAFTLAVSDVDFLENILESELPITATFTTSFTASIKYALDDTPISISSALTFTLATGFVKYDIENTPASAFTTSFIGHIKYDPSLTLSALASQLSVGELLKQADPYNIITVDAETRTFVVPTESRSTVVQEENRLNIISSETRLENVLEETRVHKLKIPGLTNIYSTPRVRSET